MSTKKTTPKPAPAPKGPSQTEYAIIIVLAAVITAIIVGLIGPAALAVIAGF